MLAHASRDTVLRAGDIFASGAVGDGCIQELPDRRKYLEPADTVKVEVEQLGAVQAQVIAKGAVHVAEMKISRSIVIAAPPSAVFDVVADARRHHDVPYEVTNIVHAYELGRLIAWAHPGQHRWRYEPEELTNGTRVTETCYFTTSPRGEVVARSARGRRDSEAVEKTLVLLQNFVEGERT